MDHSSHTSPATQTGGPPESLLEILRRRYALGEIDQDQFVEMKRVLGIEETRVSPSRPMPHEHA